jgi:uncharacterized protein YerC
MTPKEKAFHLHFSFIRDVIADNDKAKICALKSIEECIYFVYNIDTSNNIETYISRQASLKYLNDVKTELNKL